MSEVSTRPRSAATRVTKNAPEVAEAATIVASPSTAASKIELPDATSPPHIVSGKVLLELNRRFDPTAQLLEAEAAINAVEVRTGLHWAIVRLIEAAQAALGQASEMGPGRLEVASECLDEVLAVIDAVEDSLDDHLVYGAATLITLAKTLIDAKIEQQAFAAANGGAA